MKKKQTANEMILDVSFDEMEEKELQKARLTMAETALKKGASVIELEEVLRALGLIDEQ